MADYVRVPETDWQDILDAVRGKTGGTEKMLSGVVAEAITTIETGGGGTDQSTGLVDGTLAELINTEITSIRSYAFYYLSSLKRVILPNATGIVSGNAFRYTGLEFFDAPCSSLQTGTFASCTALKTLVLRRTNSVCGLMNVNVFNATPFASGGTGGTVYVPSALIKDYKTATNWSTLYAAGTCNFVAIEGSEYE